MSRSFTSDEKRVCAYLEEIIPDIGYGDDPVGFLITSHRYLFEMRRKAQQQGLEYGIHPEVHEQESP